MNRFRKANKLIKLIEQGDKNKARRLLGEFVEKGMIGREEKPAYLKDIAAYSVDNADENTVLRSTYFSCYKGKRVIRLYSDFLTSAGASKRLILLNYKMKPGAYGRATVRHEYGHTVQAERMCALVFYLSVCVQSPLYLLLTMIGRKNGWLSRNYYNMPWERSADRLGGVDPKTESSRAGRYAEWSDKLSERYMHFHEFISRLLTLKF